MRTIAAMSRAILVTGASRGIGAAAARAFAERGDRVAVHYGASRDRAEEVAAGLPGEGHVVVGADLADPDAVRAMVDAAAAALGGLDVLVNNAGVFEPHPITETTYEEWQRAWQQTLGVNLVGAANVTWCAVQHMAERRAHRQRRLARRVPRRAEGPGLRREQGRDHRLRPVARPRARAVRHRGHLGRAGLHRDRHGRGRAGGGEGGGAARGEPAGAGGDAGGGRPRAIVFLPRRRRSMASGTVTRRQRGFVSADVAPVRYRAYAAGTPPSTLSMFPVLFPDRAGEAKCSTAWAMSSGKMLTPSVVRLR